MTFTNGSPITKDALFLRFLLFILIGSIVLSILMSWKSYTLDKQEDTRYNAFIETHGTCVVNEPLEESSSCYSLTEKQCLQNSEQCYLVKGGNCEEGYCHFPEPSQSRDDCERLLFCEWKDNRCQQKPIISCFDYKLKQECEEDRYHLECKWEIASTGRRCVQREGNLPSCTSYGDEQTCTKQTNCVWRKYTTCREKLSSPEEQETIESQCSQQKSKTDCDKDKKCYWDADTNAYYDSNR